MIDHKIVLHFSPAIADQPVIYRLVREYDLVVNILKANINPHKEGYLVLELSGDQADYQAGIDFLEASGVKVEPLSQTTVHNEDRCIHCGACTTICPSAALYLERPSMEVRFDDAKCIVCGMCVQSCPAHAVELHF
jgi:ferredoxin